MGWFRKEAPPTPVEVSEIDLLVAGAPTASAEEARIHDDARFLRSNQRHQYADVLCGMAAYTFSGLQHIHGQSTGLHLFTMWAAGTTFFINYGSRAYTANMWANYRAQEGHVASDALPTKEEPTSIPATPLAATVVKLSDCEAMRNDVFKMEAVASWMWMLTSLQQFKVHKRLKWCGYSSWMGLSASMYFTMRHMYTLFTA